MQMTHCDDVIFPEAQFVVVMSFKVEQSLGASAPVAGHYQEVLVVLLVTLHGVVGSQVLQISEKPTAWESTSHTQHVRCLHHSGAHSAGVVRVQAVEMLGRAGDGLPQRRH